MAFNNDRYFYTIIFKKGESQNYHYDIILDNTGGGYNYQFSYISRDNKVVTSKFPVTGEMISFPGAVTAQGEQLNSRFPCQHWVGSQFRRCSNRSF
jgi:hypothetical protein